jgi:hypothetical protein
VLSKERSFNVLRSRIDLACSGNVTKGATPVFLTNGPSEWHGRGKEEVSVPAKVILTRRQAMQVVSTAQSLTQLARARAEYIFTRVNRVLLVSEQLCQNCQRGMRSLTLVCDTSQDT